VSPGSSRTKIAASAALALLLAGGARAALLSVVVDELKPDTRKVIAALERDLGTDNQIRVHTLGSLDLSDPVAKGRFLAQVAAADLVVPIGDPAALLVSEELDDLQTFFISAGGLSGQVLGRRHVAGILSYSPEETIRVAKALLPRAKDIGMLFTPGYEGVSLRMQSAAVEEGFSMTLYRVGSRQEVGPAVREAVTRSDLVWIVGDPLFTQDLVFAHLLQESLRFKKPLAAPLPGLVKKGALFCTVPDGERLAQLASETLAVLLAGQGPARGADRVRAAPAGGSVLLNRPLAEKWDIRVPSSLRLWHERAP
jgi:ABC-type uncharacterized transport system substrate-binding protein